MKNGMKRNVLILFTLVILMLLGGCAGGEDEGGTTDGIVVADMSGREVRLDKPAERVVALTAADCEILYALGAGDALAGRGEYCDYPAEIAEVTAVQSGSDTNVEQIIALNPQVVIMGSMAQTDEQIEAIQNAGIQVFVSDAQDIEGVYTAIASIGKVVGKDAEAARLIAEMKSTFETIRAEGIAGEEKTVYFEVSPLEYGLWTAGADTFMDEVAEMVGLKNAFSDVSGWAEISQEQVIDRDPDYIVAVPMSYDESAMLKDQILSRKGWQDMKAVKNGTVYIANSDEITRPGPRLAKAALELHDFLYGDGQ